MEDWLPSIIFLVVFYESQVSEIADKLSPIIVNKPPNKAISSEVKPWDKETAITLARVTSSQPFKLFKQLIK